MSTPSSLPRVSEHANGALWPRGRVLMAPRPRRVLQGYVAVVVLLCAIGFALRYRALDMGFAADDFAQVGMLSGHYLLPRSPLNLFTFSDGSLAETKALLHGGLYPWWAHPEVRLSMMRPLACALTWLDFTLFGTNPFPYHLHSAAWWFVMLGLVAWVFYRLLPVPVALLAFALYAVDEALGLPFGWISNRNAVLSTAFSCIALIAYLRYRDAGRGEPDPSRAPPARRDLILAAVAYSVALGAGEYAICMFGYFLAYELLVAREPPAVRLRALSALAVPALGYIAVRAALGLAPKHSGVYLDPFTQPIAFFLASLQRFPAIYADLVLAVRADWWTFGSPWVHRLFAAGLIGQDWFWTLYPWRALHVTLGVVAMIVMAVIFRVAPRDEPARNTRWLLAGGTLSVAAVLGSFPSSRLLLITMIGFAPIIASLGWSQLSAVRERWRRARVRTALATAATGSFLLYHLIVPAIYTHDETEMTVNVAHAVRRSVLGMRVDQQRLRTQNLVVLLTLEGGASLYVPLTRALSGMSTPRTCWTLSLSPCDHLLTRDSERSFVFSPVSGFTLLAGAPEAMLRSLSDAPFKLGDTVDVGGMRVKVLAMLRGVPKSIRVSFDKPLEDESLLFVLPTKNGIVPFEMPAIGQSVIVPIQGVL